MRNRDKIQYIENIKVEKLVFGGQGLAHHEGKTVFIWNALPGEIVDVRVLKKRKGIIEAVAENIHTPSELRQEHVDDHYLSSAPWQIMGEEAEEKFKLDIAKETLEKLGGIRAKRLNNLKIVSDGNREEYRNKMEFGFFIGEDEQLHLSLFHRGSRYPRPVTTCTIAMSALWSAAQKILKVLRDHEVSRWDLKYLVLRANRKGEVIAGLFVPKKDFKYADNIIKVLSDDKESLIKGVHIFYSTPKSPASVVTDYITGYGNDWIKEKLLDVPLKYGIHSFFQVNPPVFELTLKKIRQYISENADVIDFYSGVGSISIPLKDSIKSALLVDSNEEAIDFAQKNIDAHGLHGYEAKVSEAEKIVEEITSDKISIVDPPRAGLHKDVVQRILEVQPPLVIYLSCNISTQARDVKELQKSYDILEIELYNYFPQTPHFESLIVLQKKKRLFEFIRK